MSAEMQSLKLNLRNYNAGFGTVRSLLSDAISMYR